MPPLPSDELKVHADRVVQSLGCDPIFRDYIGVLLNNEMWREQLAAVPGRLHGQLDCAETLERCLELPSMLERFAEQRKDQTT